MIKATLQRAFQDVGLKTICAVSFLVGLAAYGLASWEDFDYWSGLASEPIAAMKLGATSLIFQAGVLVLICLSARLLRVGRSAWACAFFCVAMLYTGFNAVSIIGFGASQRIAPVTIAKANNEARLTAATTAAAAAATRVDATIAGLNQQISSATCTMKGSVARAACRDSRQQLIDSRDSLLAKAPAMTTAAVPEMTVKSVDAPAMVWSYWTGIAEMTIATIIVIAQGVGLLGLAKLLPWVAIYVWPTARRVEDVIAPALQPEINWGRLSDRVVMFPHDVAATIPTTVEPDPDPVVAPEPESPRDVVANALSVSPARVAANTAKVKRFFDIATRPAASATPWTAKLIYARFKKFQRAEGGSGMSFQAFSTTLERMVACGELEIARKIKEGEPSYSSFAFNISSDEDAVAVEPVRAAA